MITTNIFLVFFVNWKGALFLNDIGRMSSRSSSRCIDDQGQLYQTETRGVPRPFIEQLSRPGGDMNKEGKLFITEDNLDDYCSGKRRINPAMSLAITADAIRKLKKRAMKESAGNRPID